MLVVFSGESTIPWLRLLRPGFRHCFVVWCDGRRWLTYDPMAHATHIAAHDLVPEFDMRAWYRAAGLRVVEVAHCSSAAKPFPTFWWSCVEAVKRAIGLRRFWVWTPYQLYCCLTETR